MFVLCFLEKRDQSTVVFTDGGSLPSRNQVRSVTSILLKLEPAFPSV